MEKDDDVLALEWVAEFSEKQKVLFGRLREIERKLHLAGAPAPSTRKLVLAWLAKQLPADSPDEDLARKMRQALQAEIPIGIRCRPSVVYARRGAAVRRR
jgi:hypothetical protein